MIFNNYAPQSVSDKGKMKIGDIKFVKGNLFKNDRWLVLEKVQDNYERFYEFYNNENAFIFSELIKQRRNFVEVSNKESPKETKGSNNLNLNEIKSENKKNE